MVLRALCFFLVLLPFTIATSCNEDNCLRALRNRAPTASPYCSTYTTTSNTAVPTWASSQCASNPTRVSSACSCLNTPTPTPTPGALRKVYGPKNDTKYTVYGEHINIRSDPYYEGQTYQEYVCHVVNSAINGANVASDSSTTATICALGTARNARRSLLASLQKFTCSCATCKLFGMGREDEGMRADFEKDIQDCLTRARSRAVLAQLITWYISGLSSRFCAERV